MDTWGASAILLAGGVAGTVNAVVGSGTLVTFPTLLALGVPPVTANVSNTVGLVVGSLAGTWGYRRELAGQGGRLRLLAPMSVLGAVSGGLLLLTLPAEAFETVVPVLIVLALVLVLAQPRLARAASEPAPEGPGRGGGGPPGGSAPRGPRSRYLRWLMPFAVFLTGIYGGYFGAAQGVLLLGVLAATLPESLQRLNATKNALAALVNLVAAVTFLVVAPGRVDWTVAALIAAGSLAGGLAGARIGRTLPVPALRGVVLVIGTIAVLRMMGT